MSGGLRLATIRGIPVRAEWSVLVIVGLLAWSLATGGLREAAPGYGPAAYGVAAVVTAVVIMASLLAHELGHSFVARRSGIGVRDITLWMLGGVSRIEREPDEPGADLRIAIVGPAVSFAVAAAAGAVAVVVAVGGGPRLLVSCARTVGSVNLLLGAFNLVPAAPLDGGRVLRAILWRRTGDRTRSALRATQAGRTFAFFLGSLGLLAVVGGAAVSGIWLLLLGWFLLEAARAEEFRVLLGRDLAGVRIGEIMTADPLTVPETTTVGAALRDHVLRHRCSGFPVVASDGSVRGLVTLQSLREVPPGRRECTPLTAAVQPMAEVARAAPDELLLDVMARSEPGGESRVLVFDDGRLVGIVSPTDVTRAVRAAEAVRGP